MNNQFLVSPEWLKDHLHDENVRIIETPWKPEGFARAHIEGACLLPWHSYLKAENEEGERSVHVIDEKDFQELMGKLGIRESDDIIVYDDYYCLFATRFWWVCRYFGFDRVRVLDGAWQGWFEKGFPVSICVPEIAETSGLVSQENPSNIILMDELKDLAGSQEIQIWDTRRPEEYTGEEETSNKRRGHIPDAINLLWMDVLEESDYDGGSRYFKSKEDIEEILISSGFDTNKTVITHCQAGIRAAFGSFVLEMLGFPNHRCYDASMAEWANVDDTPLVR